MVALGGAVAAPYSGMGNVAGWEAPGEHTSLHPLAISLSLPLLSAISASPTSVILSFCGRDSKHLFLLFLFLPTLLSLPRFSSSVCPFHFRQCLDCII